MGIYDDERVPKPQVLQLLLFSLIHLRSLYDSFRSFLDSMKAHSDSSIELYYYSDIAENKKILKYQKRKAIVDKEGFHACHPRWCLWSVISVSVASKRFQSSAEITKNWRSESGRKVSIFFARQRSSAQVVLFPKHDCFKWTHCKLTSDGAKEKVGRR